MSFRRSTPGVSRGRSAEAEVNGTDSSNRYTRPTISFNLRALCDTCPPLQPIDEPALQGTGEHVYSYYRDAAAVPSYSVVFGRNKTSNYFAVNYKATGPSTIGNNELIREAESAARQCTGPTRDALGRTVCGASIYGIECRLTIYSVEDLPHPESAPPLDERGHARVR
jgi:hypothetical protein